MDDVIVAYGQNGEPLRPEQGYPLRLIVPGWEGLFNVKYLAHIKVVDHFLDPTGVNHSTMLRADLDGKSRWFHFEWGPKSVITRPSGGLKMPGKGYVQITGLAWSGGGAVSKVDVSTDGGRTWKEAKLQAPVLPKAHTRFNFDWAWGGEEAVILSRTKTGASPAKRLKNPSAPRISMPCSPGEWPATGAFTMRCSLDLLA
jgi:sulfane dehydrogenase subunit SoxC